MNKDVSKGNNRRDVLTKINESLKEVPTSSMTTTKETIKIFWRPNNYRRQIQVKTKNNSTIKKIESAIKCHTGTDFSCNTHTKMVSIKNYAQNQNNKGITIQYGKDKLIGVYSQNIIAGVKEIFLIEDIDLNGIMTKIDKKKNEIQWIIDETLNNFIKEFKLKIPYRKPEWSRYEDFIKGEEYIDKIPREVIVHDTYFKKVYGEGIEFKNTKVGEAPIAHMKNFIKNRAIEDISPEISKELVEVRELVKGTLEINVSTAKMFNDLIRNFNEFNNIQQDKKLLPKTQGKLPSYFG